MISIILIASVIVGVLLGRFFGTQQKLAKHLLIISAGFMITICLTEIFPQIYHEEGKNLGLWVIGGVLLQMLLENMTKGFEHGHYHHHSEKNILPVALVIGMFIHAFLEGIPLANETEISSGYLQGIVIHNIPISFILGAFLFRHRQFQASSWLVIVLFALASPLGIFLGQYFNSAWTPYFLAIVGGIFLHISSVIIFESNKNHNTDWTKIGLVILGVIAAVLLHTTHHH